jgi:hypothetical protein
MSFFDDEHSIILDDADDDSDVKHERYIFSFITSRSAAIAARVMNYPIELLSRWDPLTYWTVTSLTFSTQEKGSEQHDICITMTQH